MNECWLLSFPPCLPSFIHPSFYPPLVPPFSFFFFSLSLIPQKSVKDCGFLRLLFAPNSPSLPLLLPPFPKLVWSKTPSLPLISLRDHLPVSPSPLSIKQSINLYLAISQLVHVFVAYFISMSLAGRMIVFFSFFSLFISIYLSIYLSISIDLPIIY